MCPGATFRATLAGGAGGTADLEGADWRVVLMLDPQFGTKPPRQQRPAILRGRRHHPVNKHRRRFQCLEIGHQRSIMALIFRFKVRPSFRPNSPAITQCAPLTDRTGFWNGCRNRHHGRLGRGGGWRAAAPASPPVHDGGPQPIAEAVHYEADNQREASPALSGGFIGSNGWRSHGCDIGRRARKRVWRRGRRSRRAG